MNRLFNTIRRLCTKYRELIIYGIFGVLTTGVDFGVYWLLTRLAEVDTLPAQIAAITAAIIFAFITNKKWVFKDKRVGLREIASQFASFASMRVLSGAFQTFCVWLFCDIMGLYDMAVKAVVAIVVILANYVFSKLIIFKK